MTPLTLTELPHGFLIVDGQGNPHAAFGDATQMIDWLADEFGVERVTVAHVNISASDIFGSEYLGLDDPMPRRPGQVCRECGCTDRNACVDDERGPCWWVEPDLCSHCAEKNTPAGDGEAEVPSSDDTPLRVDDDKSLDDPNDAPPSPPTEEASDHQDEARETAGETAPSPATEPVAEPEPEEQPFADCTTNQRKVLKHLFRCFDKHGGRINMNYNTLADRAGVQKGSVRTITAALKAKGYIEIQQYGVGADPYFTVLEKAIAERAKTGGEG